MYMLALSLFTRFNYLILLPTILVLPVEYSVNCACAHDNLNEMMFDLNVSYGDSFSF